MRCSSTASTLAPASALDPRVSAHRAEQQAMVRQINLPCDHVGSEADGCSQGPATAHSEFTIADAANKAGMATIHLGKWHLGISSTNSP